MKQLWQSLAVVALAGSLVVLVVLATTHTFKKETEANITATTTPAVAEGPASAAAALPTNPFKDIRISGRAAIVVDLSSGRTLYSQNPDTQLPLASLTKLLTIYAAQSALSPQADVTISSSSLAADGDYGLVEGEVFAYKDIARFAMVASSNDAAQAIVEAAAAANNETPSELMRDAVSMAGLTRTNAVNGTGLDIDLTEAGAYGTARDMAKLAGEFLTKAPTVSAATTNNYVTAVSTAGVSHRLANTNPDVSRLPGILLSKTGYTDLAGGNLAIVFDAGINHNVAIVVLGSTRDARFTDVETLMRATRASFAAATQ